MFMPKEILYEENITNYKLGQELLEKYKDVPYLQKASNMSICCNCTLNNSTYTLLYNQMKYMAQESRKFCGLERIYAFF